MNVRGARPELRRGARLPALLLGLAFVAGLAVTGPAAASATGLPVKLALLPVGQAGSFFDLAMAPGATRHLEVDVANDGHADVVARTYASDVYTIVNGGFGGRLRAEPQTGMTTWLDYATEVVALPAGRVIRRGFTVTVPLGAQPGEHITSLVLENDQPIPGDGAVGLDQVIRQAVAVVVTVPGPRVPALAIGAASESIVGGRSVVSVAVSNTGNIRLKPVIGFSLADASGAEISHTTIQMGTFYARTDTFVEFPFATALAPGAYTIGLTLDEAASGAHADAAAIPLTIDPPAGVADPIGAIGGITGFIDVSPGDGQPRVSIVAAGLLLGTGAVLALALTWLMTMRRRRTRLLAAAITP